MHSPSPKKAPIPTKMRAAAVKHYVTSAAAAKANKRCAKAVIELNHLIGGDRKASTADWATDTGNFRYDGEVIQCDNLSVGSMSIGDAQRAVGLLTLPL